MLVVVADGVRPDVLANEIDAGRAPAMARLRTNGGLFEVSASFPSVTGPAYVPFVMGLCDRITVLNLGEVICEGPPESVMADAAVRSAYLG